MPANILIVDDEDSIRISLRGILEDEGYTVSEAASGKEALDYLSAHSSDLVLLDVWMPEMDGLEVLDHIHQTDSTLPVVMISGHGTIETAVTAIKQGAHDFIEKPLSLDKILIIIQRALEFSALKRENSQLKEIAEDNQVGPMGSSEVILQLREQISRVAPLDTWVLITGENGTGKELVARAIHQNSKRAEKPLVALNCAAIPDELIESELFGHEKGAFTGADQAKVGKFEMAHQGTLFLDEIGDMSLKTQAKILRILQEKSFERVGGNRVFHVDVRVVAATNKNLEEAIANGEFREDLYYRLKVFPIHVPPLRERENDILLLTDYMSSTLAQDLGLPPVSFSKEAREVLLAYQWPGNVRELRNFIERMLILHAGKEIDKDSLPTEILSYQADTSGDNMEFTFSSIESTDFKAARNAFEAQFLASKLDEYGGNVSKLAEAIGLDRSFLHKKLKSHQIATGKSSSDS